MSKSKTTTAMVTEWFLRHIHAENAEFLAGVVCPICHQQLFPGQRIDWDHTHCEGLEGPHVIENLCPLHHDCHKTKTAKDVKEMAKADRSNGTTGTRPKFAVRKLPVDQERPKGQRFGQRRTFERAR